MNGHLTESKLIAGMTLSQAVQPAGIDQLLLILPNH